MNYTKEYLKWLESPLLTDSEKDELLSIADDEKTKAMRFESFMTFGTAGLRSTMNMGIGCMNRFTVAVTTRALAALVKKCGGEKRGVVIAYDSRLNSEVFARVSALVLATEGVKAYIFDGIRPTPELSFAVRELGTLAGINITASHNPKEYNGYKAYWEDGAQIGPEQAEAVSHEIAKYDTLDYGDLVDYGTAVKDGLIVELGADFDEKYIAAVLNTSISKSVIEDVSDELKVVYTPLHGAGYRLVPEVFRRRGLKNLYTVDTQMIPDGSFPTVKKPNPEYSDVFTDGIKIANEVGSDLIIATDPDSDRVGVMARNSSGDFVTVSGNQMGALLLDYAIKARRELGTLPEGAFAVKSIVSTDMAYKIAEAQGIKLHDVLTGFKYIGEVIKDYESRSDADAFILGFEESYGYLLGSYARDKDAVEASMIILEMTAYYKKRDMTLCDALESLYREYGLYRESMLDVYMEGYDGVERRKRVMSSLRESVPSDFCGVAVSKVGDYLTREVKNLATGECESTGQPESDVLYYTLENGDKIIVRPSGTEPKIKIYILAHATDSEELDGKIKKYTEKAKSLTE